MVGDAAEYVAVHLMHRCVVGIAKACCASRYHSEHMLEVGGRT